MRQGAGEAVRETPRIRTFKDLEVWRASIELIKDVYALCARLPKDELYGLSSQMKRSSVSVASNIAEGHARSHRAEYRQFVYIAVGSLAELETQLLVTVELKFIGNDEIVAIMDRLQRLRAQLLTLGGRL